MTYNAGIPNSTDLISNSQPQIKTNFSQLNTQFAVDHVAFNTGSGNGDGTHKKITFDNAPVAPAPAGTVSNIYPSLVSGRQELIFKNASQTTQLTGPNTISANGSITLQGGVILKWGTCAAGAVSFPTAFPTNAFSLVLSGDTSNPSGNGIISFTSLSTTGFTAYQNGSGTTMYYLAIGN